MSNLVKTMEKLGSDASLAPLDEQTCIALANAIENANFPEIKNFVIIPAEDDDKEDQSDDKKDDDSNDKKESEGFLKVVSNQ